MTQSLLGGHIQQMTSLFAIERINRGIGLACVATVISEKLAHKLPVVCEDYHLTESQKAAKAALMGATRIAQMAFVVYIIQKPSKEIVKIMCIAGYALLCFYTHHVARTESNRSFHKIACGINAGLDFAAKSINSAIVGATTFKYLNPFEFFLTIPAIHAITILSFFDWSFSWLIYGGCLSHLRGDAVPLSQ